MPPLDLFNALRADAQTVHPRSLRHRQHPLTMTCWLLLQPTQLTSPSRSRLLRLSKPHAPRREMAPKCRNRCRTPSIHGENVPGLRSLRPAGDLATPSQRLSNAAYVGWRCVFGFTGNRGRRRHAGGNAFSLRLCAGAVLQTACGQRGNKDLARLDEPLASSASDNKENVGEDLISLDTPVSAEALGRSQALAAIAAALLFAGGLTRRQRAWLEVGTATSRATLHTPSMDGSGGWCTTNHSPETLLTLQSPQSTLSQQ